MFSCLENLVHCTHHMVHYTEITFIRSSKLNSYNKYFAVALAIVLSQVFGCPKFLTNTTVVVSSSGILK